MRRPAGRALLAFLTLPALLLAAAPLAAEELGRVDFPTSARSPEAQRQFLRGLAALHSFWYDEAADAFRAARAAEPGFALAHWGEALSHHHPIWAEEDLEASRAALAALAPTAAERAAKAPTEREKGYLAASRRSSATATGGARGRYAEAIERHAARFPTTSRRRASGRSRSSRRRSTPSGRGADPRPGARRGAARGAVRQPPSTPASSTT